MQKFLVCLTLCFELMFINVSQTEAVVSETADLMINAAQGLMQTDDTELEQEIIAGIQDPTERENLINYVEKTRPIIQDKTKFFQGTLTSVLTFTSRVPLVGGMATSAALNGYIMKYEHDLEKDADSKILKKFVELREHNIDAGQGLYEVFFDAVIAPYDKNTSNAVMATDATLLMTKAAQQLNRYKSSAAAIAKVLEAAGIAMQPEDIGDICQRSNSSSPSTSGSSPSTNNSQPKTSVTEPAQTSATKAGNEISIGGVSLGDSINSVNGKFGSPSKKDVAPTGFTRCSYGDKFAVDYNHDAAACLISYSSDYSTSRGIHVGSSIENFVSAYGDDYSIYRNNGLEMYEYFTNFAGKNIITRFAVEEGKNSVKYISIRYAD